MDVIKFVIANLDSIILIIVFVIAMLYLAKKGETATLNKIMFALVTQVEKEFASGTGRLKLSVVVDAVYQRMPTILRFLFSEEEIESMIENALKDAKKLWEANPALLTAGTELYEYTTI